MPRREPPHPAPTIDFSPIAGAYERGRMLSDEAFAVWRAAIAPYVPDSLPAAIVDIGAGTGMWSAMLARWFGASVLAIEPAAGMRQQARTAHPHPRVAYIGGSAEHLPLRERSAALAWLSTVIHHIGSLSAAAHEVRRVLQPSSPVLIRSAFPDGLTDLGVHSEFFPGALRVIGRFPSIKETCRIFAAAGFALEAQLSVTQESAPSLRVYLERVRSRADTTLALLSDEEFAEGLRALEDEVVREASPRPVIHRLGLLAFR